MKNVEPVEKRRTAESKLLPKVPAKWKGILLGEDRKEQELKY